MRSEPCRRAEAYVRAIDELCRNDNSRREWLWLRAQQKCDRASLAQLERGDPGLRARMAQHEALARQIRDPDERREAFGRMLDERLPDVEIDVESCRCAACMGASPS